MEEKKIRLNLRKKFLEITKDLKVDLAPINQLEFCTPETGITILKRDLQIQKEKNRWRFCRNRARVFYDLGLDRYYKIKDPRKPWQPTYCRYRHQ